MPGTLLLILTSIVWAVLHTWLASLGVKAFMAQQFGSGYKRWYRFAYNLFAALTVAPILLMMVLLPDVPLYSVGAPWVYALYALQALGALIVAAGVLSTDALAFMGIRQLFTENPNEDGGLVTSGIYRFMRHPLYTGGILFLWASPGMSLNQLTVYGMFTLYFIVGAWFEERKLVRVFGQAYVDYQARTPMFIPFTR